MLCTKYVLAFFVLMSSLFSLSCMAASGDTTFVQPLDLGLAARSNIKAISLGSCDGKTFSGTIRPNETRDFCLVFANFSSQDINVEYGFSDFQLTKDKTIACSAILGTGTFFSHVLSNGTSAILVPASGHTIQYFSLKAPMTGHVQGCIMYRSLDDLHHDGIFDIIYFNSKLVDFLVAGPYYGIFAQGLDRCKGLKNNTGFWIGTIVVLGGLFVYVLAKKPRDKKKHTK